MNNCEICIKKSVIEEYGCLFFVKLARYLAWKHEFWEVKEDIMEGFKF